MSDNKSIIIKKIKKGGAHGGHGGAWKVAYADFVTAMMAFFLLLWLLSTSSKDTLKSIADYFAPTIGIKDQKGIGIDGGKNPKTDKNKVTDDGTPALIFGAPSNGPVVKMPDDKSNKPVDPDTVNFETIFSVTQNQIKSSEELREFQDNIIVHLTDEGIVIDIISDIERPMYIPNTSKMQPYMKKILSVIGKYIKNMPNYIKIAGHTTSSQADTKGDDIQDQKWGISALRAESIRSYLVEDVKMDDAQIKEIAGKADTQPMSLSDPYSIKNIRGSIIILKKNK
jgi:chemotaxis protein MotB